MEPNSYPGFPNYHFGENNILDRDVNYAEVSYVHFASQYVMFAFAPSHSNNNINLFKSIMPNYSFNEGALRHGELMILNLIAGNDAPAKN